MKSIVYLYLFLFFTINLNGQNNFNDCSAPLQLCSNDDIRINGFYGIGNIADEVKATSCNDELDNYPETNVVWVKWKIDQPGQLAFTISPHQPNDDIDFILYKVSDQNSPCSNKKEIRCMASGENINHLNADDTACLGATGLKLDDIDNLEKQGCYNSNNNFLSAIETKEGEVYLLMINNFKSNQGAYLSFEGDATFESPFIPDLYVSNYSAKVNEEIIIKERSSLDKNTSDIMWNFGVDASPRSAEGTGPHTITYSTAGKKEILETIEMNNGCNMSHKVDINISDRSTNLTTSLSAFQIGELYPNPNPGNFVYINIITETNSTLNYRIFSKNGQLITYGSSPLSLGNDNTLIELDNQLVPGNYSIELAIEDFVTERTLNVTNNPK